MMKVIDLKETNELLKEAVLDSGFSPEEYRTLGLAFAKRGLIVVDASEYLERREPARFALVEVMPANTAES